MVKAETQLTAEGKDTARPLRIAIVGLGWVARDYMLPAIAEVAGVELVAVCDPVEPAADLFATGTVAHYRELAELLARERPDAVYVATPNHLHAAQAIACLEAGVAVLCEKPMAPTAAEAEGIAAAAQRTKTPYATAFDQRHHPAHIRAAELVRGGVLGTLTQVRLDYACWLPAAWRPTTGTADNWRIDRARAGGGAVIDLAPHGLDLVEVVAGQRLTHLTGYYQGGVHGFGADGGYAVDDGGVLVGALDGGALLAHTVGYNRPDALPRRRLELVGTAGMLLAENTMGQTAGGTLTFVAADNGKPRRIGFDASRSPFTGQLAAFAELVRGRSRPARTVADDLRLARLLETAFAKTP